MIIDKKIIGLNVKTGIKKFTAAKRALAVFVAIMMLFAALTGCSGEKQTAENGEAGGHNTETGEMSDTTGSSDIENNPGTEGSANTADSSENEGSAVFPMTVTDANGDEMVIESKPQRIVSLTLGSDEILLSLVDKNRIASLTRYADDEGISNVAAEAKGVGTRLTMDQVEKIIALNPDLIILDTWADPDYIKQLRNAGITVYAFKTPGNIDEQKAVIAELAHVVGADEKGQEIISWMDEKLKAVEEKLSALKPEQKLTVMDYGESNSSGKGTNFDDIVTRAGLINVISRAGIEGWPVISKEKII